MIKRTVEEWHQLFAEQQASGLSAAQFCRERKLCPKHFCARRKQLGMSPQTVPKEQGDSAFVALQPPSSRAIAPEIQLQCGTVRVTLPGAVSAPWLAQLIKTLQS